LVCFFSSCILLILNASKDRQASKQTETESLVISQEQKSAKEVTKNVCWLTVDNITIPAFVRDGIIIKLLFILTHRLHELGVFFVVKNVIASVCEHTSGQRHIHERHAKQKWSTNRRHIRGYDSQTDHVGLSEVPLVQGRTTNDPQQTITNKPINGLLWSNRPYRPIRGS